MSNRIGAASHMTSEGDAQIVSELIDDMRDAVMEYQVGSPLEAFLWPPFRQNLTRWHTNGPYMTRTSN